MTNETAASCNVCRQVDPDREPFTVPWSGTPADAASAAIMQGHLDEHRKAGEIK